MVLFVVAIKESRRYWSIVDTPTLPAGHAFPGFVEVIGNAHLRPGRSLVSPLSGADCAWVQWRISRGDSDSGRKTVAVITSPFHVFLRDESGEITVFLDDYAPINARSETFNQDAMPTISGGMLKSAANGHLLHQLTRPSESEKSLAFRSVTAGTVPKYSASLDLSVVAGDWAITERRIEIGDQLFVQGHASVVPEGGPLLIAGGPEGLLAYLGDEARLTSKMKVLSLTLFAMFVVTVGMCTSYASALFTRTTPTASIQMTWAKGIVGAWFALLLVLFVQSIRVRNRVVQTRERVFAARSLIDVARSKRAALIPALNEVVRGVAGHEHDSHSDAAWLRSWAHLVTRDGAAEIPIDANAQVNLHLGGLVERYPVLKANQNLQQFFRSLVQVENELATSRNYFLDAQEALRNRLQSFPDSWLALFAGQMPDMVDPCTDMSAPTPESSGEHDLEVTKR